MSASDLSDLKVKLKDGKAVGLNQSKKLIKSGFAQMAYVANDADSRLREEIKNLCRNHSVRVDETMNMAALGKMCGIDVDCSVCATTKIR
ncbi:MAG: ribosomal L7Ae/L30e/S12e/Gadd45 family protein [Clostridia bacterium]|nr:ribosomal L7Ae/L30e/S12e/Gadd45 family protein [Clostridia bacterium]